MTDFTPTKKARVLALLLSRRKVNRFELERLAHDHCPPSTISEIRAAGVEIHSRLIAVPGYAGRIARISEYSLDDGSRQRAIELLQRPSAGDHGQP